MLTACHCCGLIQNRGRGPRRCARCATRLKSGGGGNEPSAALAATALAFYPLALTSPFLTIERLGLMSESSLLGGIAAMFESGHYAVGSIVLAFSVVLPAAKLAALLGLCLAARRLRSDHRAATYRAVEWLGRWGLLDVLLAAVLVAFVKLGDVVSFSIGPGLWLFAGFALLNLAAGVAFDHHLLWEETMDEPIESSRPDASATQAGRRVWWLLPAFGVAAAAAIGLALWPEPATQVDVRFEDGRGLKDGDPVRYQGVEIGAVDSVRLGDGGGGVEVSLSLRADAAPLAVEGTRWWIVRPELGLTGAAGLETVLGPKAVTLLPGSGEPKRSFDGLEHPPLPDLAEPGGVSIVVQSTAGPRLARGAGVYHRGVRVGGIADVGLASDASAVEYEVYVRPRFRRLITGGTRFWNTGGATLGVGLDGVRLRVDSLGELLSGGMAIAVPEAGDAAADGTRYVLHAEPEEEWTTWRPSLVENAVETTPLEVAEVVVRFQEAGWLASWSGPTTRRRLGVADGERFVFAAAGLVPDDAADVAASIDGEPVEWAARERMDASAWSLAMPGEPGPSAEFAPLGVPADGRLVAADGSTTFLSAAQWVRDDAGYRVPEDRRPADGTPLVLDEGGVIAAFVVGGRLRPVVDADTAAGDGSE